MYPMLSRCLWKSGNKVQSSLHIWWALITLYIPVAKLSYPASGCKLCLAPYHTKSANMKCLGLFMEGGVMITFAAWLYIPLVAVSQVYDQTGSW